MRWWRIRKMASTTAWQLLFFGTGVLAGVFLVTMAPGMPWSSFIEPQGATSTDALDLAVQRSMASAAWWMVMITAVSSTVGGIGLWLIYHTLRETKRSADAAEDGVVANREIGKAQTRAYLTATNVKIAVPDDDFFVRISVQIANSGQSPGRAIRARIRVAFTDYRDLVENPLAVVVNTRTWSDIASGQHAEHEVATARMEQPSILQLRKDMNGIVANVSVVLGFTDVFGDDHLERFKFRQFVNPEVDWNEDIAMQTWAMTGPPFD